MLEVVARDSLNGAQPLVLVVVGVEVPAELMEVQLVLRVLQIEALAEEDQLIMILLLPAELAGQELSLFVILHRNNCSSLEDYG